MRIAQTPPWARATALAAIATFGLVASQLRCRPPMSAGAERARLSQLERQLAAIGDGVEDGASMEANTSGATRE